MWFDHVLQTTKFNLTNKNAKLYYNLKYKNHRSKSAGSDLRDAQYLNQHFQNRYLGSDHVLYTTKFDLTNTNLKKKNV